MSPPSNEVRISLPAWGINLFDRPERYIAVWGGRGGQKSTTVAINILLYLNDHPGTVAVVVRQFAAHLNDQAIALLWQWAQRLGIPARKAPRSTRIDLWNGSYIFALGAERNLNNLRGVETATIAWLEEAVAILALSFDMLDPSMRLPNAKIVCTFNPVLATDYVYQLFVANPIDNAYIVPVNYGDYPEFNTPELDAVKARYEGTRDFRWHWYGELAPVVGGIFDVQQLTIATVTDSEDTIRAIDLAYSENPAADYTVIGKVDRADGHLYYSDIYRVQLLPDALMTLLQRLAAQDGPHVTYVIEQQPGGAGVMIQNQVNAGAPAQPRTMATNRRTE